jgi:hypothetical protein
MRSGSVVFMPAIAWRAVAASARSALGTESGVDAHRAVRSGDEAVGGTAEQTLHVAVAVGAGNEDHVAGAE